MKYKAVLFFFISIMNFCSFADDSTLIYGSWKIHYYHIYKQGKGQDTTFYTSGYVHFNKNHTYTIENEKRCFMESNDYGCPEMTGGTWGYIADKFIKLTYNGKEIVCKGDECLDLVIQHGINIIKLSEDEMVLRAAYFNKKRRGSLIIDAYLVRRIE